MNTLPPHCISNIGRRSCFLYRCGSVHSKNLDINEHILSKIWNVKNHKTKKEIVKLFRKEISQYNLNISTIDYVLKYKRENRTGAIDENMKRISGVPSQTFSSNEKIMKEIQCGKISNIDNVNRPVRSEPGEVIWGFIPKEWPTSLIPKTGHSGFYTLLVTLGTYLFSKEIYVCDHDYYNGISLALLCIYVVKKLGPALAKYLDKEIDNYERHLNTWKDQKMQNLKDAVLSEKKYQECIEGQRMLVDAKRENVHLQREAEFRSRQMHVYENVIRILNYHVEHEEVKRLIQRKNFIQWVTKEVEKSLTPELHEKYMSLCMADIQEILKKHENEK